MSNFNTSIKKNKYRSHKRAIRTRNAVIYFFLIVISIIWLIPFVYLIFQSLSSLYSPNNFMPYLPTEENIQAGYPVWTYENYVKLFTDPNYPFWRWYLNTFIIAFVTMIIQTVIVLGTSYALSRLRFTGRQGIMKLVLVLGMFPGFLSTIIIYFTLQLINLDSNIFSLILIYIASSAMQYYIAKGFFDTIPKSLDEAAMIDGANKNTIFFKIIMPLSKPIVVYTMLISFTSPWGDFMTASLIAGGNPSSMTVAVGLRQMITLTQRIALFPTFCAGGVVVAIPIMILFFFLQKYYVEGITGGAVKG